jgi:death-on-curing protein
MKRLSKEQVLALHHELIQRFGGEDGLRDEGLLESALAAPFQVFAGQFAFTTVQQKAARLGFGLISNHPFIDGNKRIGAHVMLVVLAMNGIELTYTQKELYETILQVASGEASYESLLSEYHGLIGPRVCASRVQRHGANESGLTRFGRLNAMHCF